MKTRHVLMAFTFIVLLIFLIIVVSSRSTEMGKLYPDDVDIDAGLTQTAPSPQASAEANYDVNPAPEKTGSPKDTKPDIDIDSWQYLLANSDNNIGKYSPQVVAVEETAQYFDERAVDALVDFLDAARAAGYSPYIMASYRPYSSQEYIYNGKASQLSWPDYPDAQDYADAAKLVAAPGTSDHQTGLAVDITDKYYSTMDASQLATQKAASEAKLKELQTAKTTVDNQITKIKAEKEYTDAQAVVTEQDAIIKTQQAEKEKLLQTLTDVYSEVSNAEGIRKEIDNQKIRYVSELTQWDSIFLDLVEKCDKDYRIIDECFKGYVPGSPTPALLARIGSSKTSDSDYYSAYVALMECYYGALNGNGTRRGGLYTMQNELQVAVINDEIKKAEKAKSTSETIVSNYERSIESLENQSEALDTQITDQQTAVDKLTSASSAAETVKSTKKTLEDLVFKQNLGDSSSIDMEASKKAIERKQEEVAKLRENADELEVKSSVSGTIASISASAGKSIGGEEQPLATINVTDRGFTVKIDVTNEQAKKVKVGDTAELVNFWGGDAVATLDQITNSQSSGSRTLVFTLTGDIQAGQNITLSIGQKSSNYDALIPLSGLREDSNGKFVYVLQSKNSPLGSRYIATRVTVQELARDDKSAAVSGISQGDFIITTSNKPVEAGKQVRLADNG